MKYLVMECRLSYAVVLDETGRFLAVANRNYQVGQTVTDIVELELPQTEIRKTRKHPWLKPLAAAAACLILVVTGAFYTWQMPYASVYMTINPEVRIDVSRRDRVVGVEGVNPDGMDLLEGYRHQGKQLDMVMDELVDRAIDKGYLHEGGKVTLTLDADETWVTDHGEALSTNLNQHLTDRITVTIDIEQTSVPAAPTAPSQSAVIPVTPNSYGESDYGDLEDGTTDYDVPEPDDGPSDYGVPEADEGQSPYDAPDDEGLTDYGEPDNDEGQSPYDPPDADDKQTDYDEPDPDDGQSDYDAPEDGISDYDAPEPEDGDSDYEESDDEDDS